MQPAKGAVFAVAGLVLIAAWAVYAALCAGWRAEAAAEREAKALRERETAVEGARLAAETWKVDTGARQAAQERAHLATVLRLAAQGRAALDKTPQRGLLLAAEGAKLDLARGGKIHQQIEQVLREGLEIVGGEAFLSPMQWPADCRVLAISANRRWVVASNGKLWDFSSLEDTPEPVTLDDGLHGAVAFSADSRRLVVISPTQVRCWDLSEESPKLILTAELPKRGKLPAFAISPRGRWLAVSAKNGIVQLWDLSAPERQCVDKVFSEANVLSRVLAFSPDDTWLASGHSQEARLWNLRESKIGGQSLRVSGRRPIVEGLAFSPDRRWLVTLNDSSKMEFWKLDDKSVGRDSVDVTNFDRPTLPLIFSPDGRWLACPSSPRLNEQLITSILPIWPLERNDREFRLSDAGPPTMFSANGKVLVTNREGLWQAWEMPEAETRRNERPRGIVLGRHHGTEGLRAPLLSASGKQLATFGASPEIRVWTIDLERRNQSAMLPREAEYQALRGHDGQVERVIQSIDEAWLVSFAAGEPPRRWNAKSLVSDKSHLRALPSEQLVPLARQATGRELSAAERKEFLHDD